MFLCAHTHKKIIFSKANYTNNFFTTAITMFRMFDTFWFLLMCFCWFNFCFSQKPNIIKYKFNFTKLNFWNRKQITKNAKNIYVFLPKKYLITKWNFCRRIYYGSNVYDVGKRKLRKLRHKCCDKLSLSAAKATGQCVIKFRPRFYFIFLFLYFALLCSTNLCFNLFVKKTSQKYLIFIWKF